MGTAVANPFETRTHRDLWTLGVLPLLTLGTLAGLLGIYWDIAWHISLGRDTFFSPPHLLFYANIVAILMASAYGLIRDHRKSVVHMRLFGKDLHAGLLLTTLAAALVLVAAPFDELWHRLFGLDLSVWAPMHLILLLGMVVGALSGVVTAWLEYRLANTPGRKVLFGRLTGLFLILLLAWLILTLGEFEFGVLQFPSFWHPLLLSAFTSFVLVLSARLLPFRWAATFVAVGYLGVRLLVTGGLLGTASLGLAGNIRPAIPVLILSGLLSDVLTRRGTHGWALGTVAGAGTMLVNWGVVALGDGVVWYPDTVFKVTLPTLVLAAVAGWAGSSMAQALGGTNVTAREPRFATLLLFPLLLLAAPSVQAHSEEDAAARATTSAKLTVTGQGADQPSFIDVRITPVREVRNAELNVWLWREGDDALFRKNIQPAAPGHYRAAYAFPQAGTWNLELRYGPGLAGTWAQTSFLVKANGVTQETTSLDFYRNFAIGIPVWVNTAGYAVFAFFSLLTLTGVVGILAQIEHPAHKGKATGPAP